MWIFIVIALLIIAGCFSSKSEGSPNKEKSFFFDGGDDFTTEDIEFLEMIEDENFK